MICENSRYLTKDGIPNMERVQKIMTGLGGVEDEIFKRRQQDEERREANYKAKRGRFDNSPRGYSRYFSNFLWYSWETRRRNEKNPIIYKSLNLFYFQSWPRPRRSAPSLRSFCGLSDRPAPTFTVTRRPRNPSYGCWCEEGSKSLLSVNRNLELIFSTNSNLRNWIVIFIEMINVKVNTDFDFSEKDSHNR